MANKFQFKLLTGSDPNAQYAAIPVHDAYTFYLLNNGVGYLGDVPLFGGDAERFIVLDTAGTVTTEPDKVYVVTTDGVILNSGNAVPQGIYSTDSANTVTNTTYKTIAKYITDNAIKDMTGSGYTGDDNTVATTKAIVDYVNAQPLLKSKFFKSVTYIKVTQNDLDGLGVHDASIFPSGTHVDDIGMIFVLDSITTPDDDSDDVEVFINLHELINIYDVENSDSINMTATNDGEHGIKFKAELKVNTTENSIVVDSNGVSLNKSNANIDKTLDATASADKLVTEASMVAYIRSVLEDYVSYSEDDGSVVGP